MSDDENDFVMCKYCEDKRGTCDRNFLVDGRGFSIKLDETFEVNAVSHNDKSFLLIKHMLHLLQLIILNFHYSASVSPAMQDFLSWIR